MSDSDPRQGNPRSDCGNPCSQAVDFIADTCNHIVDAFAWFSGRVNSSGNVFKISDALGASAEVLLSIPVGGTGEVVVVLGKTRKNYPAKALNPEQSFERGAKVRIVDIASCTMYVESDGPCCN